MKFVVYRKYLYFLSHQPLISSEHFGLKMIFENQLLFHLKPPTNQFLILYK